MANINPAPMQATFEMLDALRKIMATPKDFEANMKLFFAMSEQEKANEQIRQDKLEALNKKEQEISEKNFALQENSKLLDAKKNEIDSVEADLLADKKNHETFKSSFTLSIKKHQDSLNALAADKTTLTSEKEKLEREKEQHKLNVLDLGKRKAQLENKMAAVENYETELKNKAKGLRELASGV